MFDTGPVETGAKLGTACRPDPEVMLQQSRKRKEKCQRLLDAMMDMEDVYLPGPRREGELYDLVGSLVIAIKKEDNAIERLLKEIDSDK